MTKEKFNQIVREGLDRRKNLLIVKIMTEGNPAAEIIINPLENIPAKLKYYNAAYNDDLELITAKNNGKSVRIIDAVMTNNLNGLDWFMY